MTPEEAKKMEGVEFTYVFEDGDTIQAYVKKFDPEVGLTCLSLDTKTRLGWKPNNKRVLEADGTFCVLGVDANNGDGVERALRILKGIKEKGHHNAVVNRNPFASFSGCVF